MKTPDIRDDLQLKKIPVERRRVQFMNYPSWCIVTESGLLLAGYRNSPYLDFFAHGIGQHALQIFYFQ